MKNKKENHGLTIKIISKCCRTPKKKKKIVIIITLIINRIGRPAAGLGYNGVRAESVDVKHFRSMGLSKGPAPFILSVAQQE